MRLVLATVVASLSCSAWSQSAPSPAPDWKTLNDQSIALFQKGDIDGATQAAAKALDAATAALGPEHLRVATMENNLAALYRMQKKYAEA